MSSTPLPRTVLVTGAAKRLGREIALALAKDGWRVAIHYRDSLEDATKTVADCAQLTRGSAAVRANLT
ncbi:MAG: SDR family NAD(P)-dependent oxidoreductase, partial [Pseudomonadota bacterium]